MTLMIVPISWERWPIPLIDAWRRSLPLRASTTEAFDTSSTTRRRLASSSTLWEMWFSVVPASIEELTSRSPARAVSVIVVVIRRSDEVVWSTLPASAAEPLARLWICPAICTIVAEVSSVALDCASAPRRIESDDWAISSADCATLVEATTSRCTMARRVSIMRWSERPKASVFDRGVTCAVKSPAEMASATRAISAR